MQEKIILDENAVNRAITRISYEIIEYNKGAKDLVILGILSGGKNLAKKIGEKISAVESQKISVGLLDITMFRDDIKVSQTHKDISEINFEIEGKTVVLVDDVMYTGRSVRSAIDAIMHKGRPKAIKLAVLIDRGHRELPIRADFVGKNLPTSKSESVKVIVEENESKVLLI